MVLVKLVVMYLMSHCWFRSSLFLRDHVKLDVLYNGCKEIFLYIELVLFMQDCWIFGAIFNILTLCPNKFRKYGVNGVQTSNLSLYMSSQDNQAVIDNIDVTVFNGNLNEFLN